MSQEYSITDRAAVPDDARAIIDLRAANLLDCARLEAAYRKPHTQQNVREYVDEFLGEAAIPAEAARIEATIASGGYFHTLWLGERVLLGCIAGLPQHSDLALPRDVRVTTAQITTLSLMRLERMRANCRFLLGGFFEAMGTGPVAVDEIVGDRTDMLKAEDFDVWEGRRAPRIAGLPAVRMIRRRQYEV